MTGTHTDVERYVLTEEGLAVTEQDRTEGSAYMEGILTAWRRYIPSVTMEEMSTLLPLIAINGGPLARMVKAFRAGRIVGLTEADYIANTAMAARLVEAEHYESMLLNHVPRDMWAFLGVHTYEEAQRG